MVIPPRARRASVLLWGLLLLPSQGRAQDASVGDASTHDSGVVQDAALPVDAATPADAAPAADAAPSDAALPPDAALPDGAVACGSVDTLGQCQGTVLSVCSSGALNQVDCRVRFGPGFTCALVPPTLAAQCTFVADDGGTDAVDAGQGGADGGTPTPSTSSSSGCGCLKPSWGQGGLWLSALLFLRPGRRRVLR